MIAGKDSFNLQREVVPQEVYEAAGGNVIKKTINQDDPKYVSTPRSHCAIHRNSTLRSLIQKSRDAYITDGIFKQGIDKYFEFFRDIEFKGKEEQVKYLQNRLNKMSLEAGEHWKSIIQMAILDLLKVGTAVLIKQRGNNNEKRSLYKSRTSAVAQLIPADILAFEPFEKDNVMVGWKLDNSIKLPLKKSGNLKGGFVNTPSYADVFISNADLLVLTYRKGPDSFYGVGMGFAALEDINLLRGLEQVITIMIKKFAMPTMHHTVERPPGFVGSLQAEINNANALWARSGPDAVIVTPANHSIKVVGSESQAMRAEGYIKQTTARACASMGLNPYALGFESGTIGSDKATKEMMLNRVRSIQVELANNLEMFLINELLWEGGFDPYNNSEDRVRLQFTEIDMDTIIKSQNHAADLFQKEAISHGELRQHLEKDEKTPIEEFRTHKIGAVEHKFNKEIADDKQKAKDKKPAGRPRKESLPSTPEELSSFLNELENWYGLPKETVERLAPFIEELMSDPLALQELIGQHTDEI